MPSTTPITDSLMNVAGNYKPNTVVVLAQNMRELESILSASQAREAELRERLKEAENDAAEFALALQDAGEEKQHWVQCAEAAEARIKASQEQDYAAKVNRQGFIIERDTLQLAEGTKLYTQPPIPPELAELQRENAELSSKVCDDCDGDGWNYNAVEGQVPCVCMTESEPYQKLEAENAELTRKLAEQQAYDTQLSVLLMTKMSADEWATAVMGLNTSTEELSRLLEEAKSKAVPDILFDGYAVFQEVKSVYPARMRTSPENVSDVLDAVVRILRATKPQLPESKE